MSPHNPSPNPSLSEPPLVTGLAVSAEAAAESVTLVRESEPTVPVSKGYITALVVSYFALYVAWIAPTAFSLAIRIQQLDAAGKNGIIALAVGLPSLTV